MISSPTLSTYVAAMNSQDAKGFAALFTADAEVQDEGHTHRGPVEIEAWIVEAWRKYQAKLSPQSVSGAGPNLILSAEVSGSFDGSPIVLQHHFELRGEKIAKLHITV